jgi:flagellar basal body-associated protein FliL
MNRKIIIGAAALVATAGLAVGAVMYGPWPIRAARPAKVQETPRRSAAKTAKVAYVDVKELTLRLADTSAEHYIRLSPILAVPTAAQEKVEERIPVVRDRIVTIVTAQTSTELATPDGEQQLKRDLLKSLQEDFGDDVVDIYFSGYLVE